MKRQTKLNSSEQQQAQAAEQQTQKPSALEFATPEELLRYDAARTTVPSDIARRLQKSIGQSAVPGRPWWRKIFGA